jgi:hypothetical protein
MGPRPGMMGPGGPMMGMGNPMARPNFPGTHSGAAGLTLVLMVY